MGRGQVLWYDGRRRYCDLDSSRSLSYEAQALWAGQLPYTTLYSQRMQCGRGQEGCTGTIVGELAELLILEFRELVLPVLDLYSEGFWRPRQFSFSFLSYYYFCLSHAKMSFSGLFLKDVMKIKYGFLHQDVSLTRK